MLNAPVVEIDPVARVARAADGRSWSYRSLLSTMPLDQLIRMSGGLVRETVAGSIALFGHAHCRGGDVGGAAGEVALKMLDVFSGSKQPVLSHHGVQQLQLQ